jgi:dinuclear metal center YbgI/SA1388 family protein
MPMPKKTRQPLSAIDQLQFKKFLDNFLQVEKYLMMDYAPNGLQVEGSKLINKILFSVSASLAAIKKAVEIEAQALVVHHGILWKHQTSHPIIGAHYQRVSHLIKNNINLYAYHLPLDGHQGIGNAVSVAQLLKLKKIKPFGYQGKAPLGCSGEFLKAIKSSELKKRLKLILDHGVMHADPGTDGIKSIAIITGGAAKEWALAAQEGFDAYLTGEMSEYHWHDAKEAGVHLFAGGHHATEKLGIKNLMKHVTKEFKTRKLDCHFFDEDNPA